jgi:glycogen synthase
MTGMREELKKALQERVGLDESTAERVVEVVVEFIKEKGLSLLTSPGKSGGGLFGRLFGR